MQRVTRILPIALAMAVSLAPVAIAANQQGGGGGTATKQQMSGMQHMLPGGISMKGQMDHAYTEALSAHESVALGMNDMAANHLSNVELTLGHLEDQMAGGGGAGQGHMMNSQMRQQLSAIRQDAGNLRGNMGDRANALKGTSQLVTRFVTFYNTMGTTMPAGGGGGAQQPMKSPAELMGGASKAAAHAQASIVGRDWTAANLHARDMVAHLEQAEKASRTAGLQANRDEMKHLSTLRTDARKLVSAIDSKSKDAAKQAGSLVTRIGAEIMHVADATMGGGAGMHQQQMDR